MIERKAVVVTTEHRGVFFGYVTDESQLPQRITLQQARNCVSWTPQERGFLGLAVSGPGAGCRVGPPASELTLWGITSVGAASEQAVAAWEAAPWA